MPYINEHAAYCGPSNIIFGTFMHYTALMHRHTLQRPCVLNGPEGGSQKVEVENGVVQEWCISLHWIAFWAPCSGILSQIICNHVDSLPSNDRIVIVVVDDLGSFHAINEILVLSYPVQWVFYSERVCSASEFHHQTCTWIHTHSAHSFAIRMHRSCMSS